MFLFDRLYLQEKGSPSLFVLLTHVAFIPALGAERNLLHIFESVRLQMHANKSFLCQSFFNSPDARFFSIVIQAEEISKIGISLVMRTAMRLIF